MQLYKVTWTTFRTGPHVRYYAFPEDMLFGEILAYLEKHTALLNDGWVEGLEYVDLVYVEDLRKVEGEWQK